MKNHLEVTCLLSNLCLRVVLLSELTSESGDLQRMSLLCDPQIIVGLIELGSQSLDGSILLLNLEHTESSPSLHVAVLDFFTWIRRVPCIASQYVPAVAERHPLPSVPVCPEFLLERLPTLAECPRESHPSGQVPR